MKTAAKILLVNKNGQPRTDVTLDEGALHLNKGDQLHVLNQRSLLGRESLQVWKRLN